MDFLFVTSCQKSLACLPYDTTYLLNLFVLFIIHPEGGRITSCQCPDGLSPLTDRGWLAVLLVCHWHSVVNQS